MSIYKEMEQAEIETIQGISVIWVKADTTSEAILANHGHKPGGMLPLSYVYQGDNWYEIPRS